MCAPGADLGGGCRGAHPPPHPPWMTCGFLIQLVFSKKKTMWFIGVEVEQETSAPPPKKNPGSAPVLTGAECGKGLFHIQKFVRNPGSCTLLHVHVCRTLFACLVCIAKTFLFQFV